MDIVLVVAIYAAGATTLQAAWPVYKGLRDSRMRLDVVLENAIGTDGRKGVAVVMQNEGGVEVNPQWVWICSRRGQTVHISVHDRLPLAPKRGDTCALALEDVLAAGIAADEEMRARVSIDASHQEFYSPWVRLVPGPTTDPA